MNIRKTSGKNFFLFALLLLLFSLGVPAYAKDSAAISYQKVSQNKVVFAVEVSSPAPSSLIVQHYHSSDNNLVAASPRAQRIDNGRGYSKWLLKGVRPGVYPFSLTFSKNVRPGNIQLILRYRDPRGGRFFEKSVRP